MTVSGQWPVALRGFSGGGGNFRPCLGSNCFIQKYNIVQGGLGGMRIKIIKCVVVTMDNSVVTEIIFDFVGIYYLKW